MSVSPRDKFGRVVQVGACVRLLSLTGDWLDNLADDARQRVLSMVGDVFKVEEIDEYGHPCIERWFEDEDTLVRHCHWIALDSDEMELVDEH